MDLDNCYSFPYRSGLCRCDRQTVELWTEKLKQEKKGLLIKNSELENLWLERQRLREEFSEEFAMLSENNMGEIEKMVTLESTKQARKLDRQLRQVSMKIQKNVEHLIEKNKFQLDEFVNDL